jgi:hypothetical protein
MHRVVVLAFALATAANCSDPLLSKPPTITGNVVAAWNHQLLVVAPGGDVACDIAQRAQVGIERATIIRRSGGTASAADIVVGTTVSAWTTGGVLESCPGQVGAKIVVIEDAPRR